MAKIYINDEHDIKVLDITGQIIMDNGGVTLVGAVIRQQIESAKKKKILLNFADVPDIDIAGISMLERMHDLALQAGCNLKLCDLPREAWETLVATTKTYRPLDIFPNRVQAIEGFDLSLIALHSSLVIIREAKSQDISFVLQGKFGRQERDGFLDAISSGTVEGNKLTIDLTDISYFDSYAWAAVSWAGLKNQATQESLTIIDPKGLMNATEPTSSSRPMDDQYGVLPDSAAGLK